MKLLQVIRDVRDGESLWFSRSGSTIMATMRFGTTVKIGEADASQGEEALAEVLSGTMKLAREEEMERAKRHAKQAKQVSAKRGTKEREDGDGGQDSQA